MIGTGRKLTAAEIAASFKRASTHEVRHETVKQELPPAVVEALTQMAANVLELRSELTTLQTAYARDVHLLRQVGTAAAKKIGQP